MLVKYKGQLYKRVDSGSYKKEAQEIFKEVDLALKAYSRLFLIFKRELEPLKGKIKDSEFAKLEELKAKCLDDLNKGVNSGHQIVKILSSLQ